MSDELLRARATRALRRYFEARRSPRVMLALIVALGGLAAFGASWGLLQLGVTLMWVRYPISLLLAYGVFLFLVWIWAEMESHHVDTNDPEFQAGMEGNEPEPTTTYRKSEEHRWLDVFDFGSGFDGDGILPVVLIVAVAGLVAVVVSFVWVAPILLAEVAIDALLAGALYRHLRIAAREHWLGAALRRTWWRVLLAAALLAIIGGCLDVMAPSSDSIGMALKEILNPGQNPPKG